MFALLQKDLSVEHEAFASPLNVTLSSYTSAYPDTDIHFGSSGNFFIIWKEILERGGSFELNPPFVEDHMILVAIIAEYAMMFVTEPLSMIIVIPSWEDCLAFTMLKASKYNVLPSQVLNFDRQEHYYQNGSNFDLETPDIRPANGKTSVFILQNEKGKATYPITPEFIEDFTRRFTSPLGNSNDSSGEEGYAHVDESSGEDSYI
jgi:phosphorylated CTD-interacting factor 1